MKGDHHAKDHSFIIVQQQAEEAMKFYTSILKNSKIMSVTRYGEAGPGPKGSVLTASFLLDSAFRRLVGRCSSDQRIARK